ncbi:MAG: TspO/MBR family protein, partial [Planctomycetota bacterium]
MSDGMRTDRSRDLPPLRRWGLLVVCILLCQSAGAIGALALRREATWAWHNALAKPPINPPGWVFGPVWTALYTLMGLSLWLAIRHGRGMPGYRMAVGLFLI